MQKKGKKEIILEVEIKNTGKSDADQQKAFKKYSKREKERTLVRNKTFKGTLNLGKVSTGEHMLKVTKVGYKDWQNTLSFYPGEIHIVLADLKDKTNKTPLTPSCKKHVIDKFFTKSFYHEFENRPI